MITPTTSTATDQATDGNGELTTTPWHDVRDNQATGRTAPPVLIASDDKPTGDRLCPAADAEEGPA